MYNTPWMITFVIWLLCGCSGLPVPAGILRICEYGPVLRSPEMTANCVPLYVGKVDRTSAARMTP